GWDLLFGAFALFQDLKISITALSICSTYAKPAGGLPRTNLMGNLKRSQTYGIGIPDSRLSHRIFRKARRSHFPELKLNISEKGCLQPAHERCWLTSSANNYQSRTRSTAGICPQSSQKYFASNWSTGGIFQKSCSVRSYSTTACWRSFAPGQRSWT